MFCPRCLLVALALYFSLEELCAFFLPQTIRQKRDDDSWSEEGLSLHLSELSDLGDRVPGDTAESAREWGTRQSRPSPFLSPLERLSVSHYNSPHSTTKDKRRRVSIPLDSISGSFVSTLWSRKDNPEDYREEHIECLLVALALYWPFTSLWRNCPTM